MPRARPVAAPEHPVPHARGGVAGAAPTGGGEARLLSGVVDPRGRHPRPLLATAVFPMPDTVRSVSALRGVVAAAVHEQKLELAKRLL